MDGEVEMIRVAGLLSLLPAQREDAVRSKNRSTADKIAVNVDLKFILVELTIGNFTGILSFQRNELRAKQWAKLNSPQAAKV